MVYNISVCGLGNNSVSTSYTSIKTVQGSRRYCFSYIREFIIKITKELEEKSGCFSKVEFEVHIGRIKNEKSRLDYFIIPAVDVLKYRKYREIEEQ